MNTNDSSAETQRTAIAKKPYEKPTFRYEKVFVTSALTCGKISATQSSCQQGGTRVS